MHTEQNQALVQQFLEFLQLKKYKHNSIRSYQNQLGHYLTALTAHNTDLLEVDFATFEEIAKTWSTEMPTNSLNSRLSKIRTFHQWMLNRNIMQHNPISKEFYIKQENIDRPVLSKLDIETIKENDASLFNHTRLAIRLMIYSGLRVSECRKIVASSIRIYENAITFQVDSDKFSKSRTCILTDKETIAMLLKYVKSNHRFGHYLKLGSQSAIQEYLYSLKDKLSMIATTHDLRRFYATSLARQNVPIFIISKLLGHENITTTQKYILLKDADVLEHFQVGEPRITPAP